MSRTFTISPKTQPVADANPDIVATIDSIKDTWVAWRVASDYCWKLDSVITQIVNNLFNQVRDKYVELNGIQALNEVSAMLAHETELADQFAACGFDHTGPITNLRNLIDLRDEAYEICKVMCQLSNPDVPDVTHDRVDPITGAVYKALHRKVELNEMFLDFEPRTLPQAKIDAHAVELLKLATEYYSDADEQNEFVDGELAAFRASQLKEIAQINEGLARNGPVKQLILEECMKIEGITDVAFTYELDTALLASLLRHIAATTTKVKEWNRKRWGLSDLAKSMAVAEIDKVRRDIELTLRTPRFNEGVAFSAPVRKTFRSIA